MTRQRCRCLRWVLCGIVLVAASEGLQPAEADLQGGARTLRAAAESDEARAEALGRLEAAGRQAGEAAEGLVQFTGDPAGPLDLRCRAVLVLGEIGLRNAEQAARLFAVLGDAQADDELRWTLLMTFGDRAEWSAELRPVLLEILADPTENRVLRRQALFGLRDGVGDEAVAEALLEILGRVDDDPTLRDDALAAVQSRAERPPEVVLLLAARAADRSELGGFRVRVLRVLQAWQNDAAEALQVLAEGVMDAQAETALRLQMVETLGHIGSLGPIASDLAAVVLQADTPAELREAIAGLADLGGQPLPGQTEDWLRVLDDPSQPQAVRRLALRALTESEWAESTEDLLRRCVGLVRDQMEDIELRLQAARFLQQRGAEVESVLADLMNLMGDTEESEVLREGIGAVLVAIARSWLSPQGRPARHELELRLADVEALQGLMTRQAVRTLAGRQQREAIDQVQSVLHREWQSRWWDRAVSWAGRRPWGAAGIVLAGLVVVAGLVYGVRRVWVLRPARLPSPIINVARDPGHAAPDQISELVQQVLAIDNPNRSEAVEQLSQFGSGVEPVVPRLIEALEDRDEELDLRFAALTVLGLIGRVARPAQGILVGVLEDPGEPVFLRMKVMEILHQLAGEDSDVTAKMVKRLVDPREVMLLRLKAGQCLCDRSATLPEWRDALQDLQHQAESGELQGIARQLATSAGS